MRLNGYHVAHRCLRLFTYHGVLDSSELDLYRLLIEYTAYDRRQVKKFGKVQITLEEAARYLGYKSISSVSAKLRKLINLGMVKQIARGVYGVHDVIIHYNPASPTFGHAKKFTDHINQNHLTDEEIIRLLAPKLQSKDIQLRSPELMSPVFLDYSDPRYLVSSKVESTFSLSTTATSLSDDDIAFINETVGDSTG